VFQPFVSRKPGGTGLGLALVSQVVRAHGGSIRVDESPLGGARFEAVLPLDAPESA
jgi:signal transduction histidine kinase